MSYWHILMEQTARVRQTAVEWYGSVARWLLLTHVLLYVTSCVIASGLVGPVGYIEFLYHCCHWKVSHG